jgi:TRL-like protein family
MKKITFILTIALLTSCSVAGPMMVTNNPVGSKRGEAKRKIFLGITFGHTDLSLATAAKDGGITKIATVDWKVTGGFFTRTYSVIVTGE